jgi:hypothetical protein
MSESTVLYCPAWIPDQAHCFIDYLLSWFRPGAFSNEDG